MGQIRKVRVVDVNLIMPAWAGICHPLGDPNKARGSWLGSLSALAIRGVNLQMEDFSQTLYVTPYLCLSNQ